MEDIQHRTDNVHLPLLGFERRRARRRGIANGRGAAVTAIQRLGSALNTNVHFHTLVVQGVDCRSRRRGAALRTGTRPHDRDVARFLATVQRRISRLVARHGIDLANRSAEGDGVDPRQLESPAYAAMQGAAVLGGSQPASGQAIG